MKPYYESPDLTLYHGDSLTVLPSFAPGAFDTIVTDPPYGQSNEGYDGPGAISLRPDVWAECFRVCGPNAALLSFAGSPTYHRIATAIEAGGWKVRQMWMWVYRDGMITSAYPKEGFDRLCPAMDPIVFATKGKVLLNVEREGDTQWHVDRKDARMTYSGRSTSHGVTTAKGRYPRTIASDGVEPFEYFIMARTSAGRRRSTDHPNEKPLDLMRWLVAKLPGRRFLDPFAGSCTTLVAARAEGRECVGIEQDAAHCAIAASRIGANPTPDAAPEKVA